MSLDFKVRNILVSKSFHLFVQQIDLKVEFIFLMRFLSGIWNDVLLDRLPLDCKAADQFDRLYWTESQDSVDFIGHSKTKRLSQSIEFQNVNLKTGTC